MKRRLLIEGKEVQDIGYWVFLLDLASWCGLTGFHVRNLNKKGVEVLYEGDDKSVRAFESEVRVKMPEGAEVEEMSFEDYDGPVKEIEKFTSHLITLQLGKLIEIGEKMLEVFDKHFQKQDATINELEMDERGSQEHAGEKIG